MPRKQEPEFVRVSDAARMLGVHRNTITRMLRDGDLHEAGRDPLDHRAVLIRLADVQRIANMVARPQKESA
jgi:hypothetical protein